MTLVRIMFVRQEGQEPEIYRQAYPSAAAAQPDMDELHSNGHWFDEDGNGPFDHFSVYTEEYQAP